MGNCCGRESGNFSGEGRTLGSTPANAPSQTDRARAPAPKISAGQKLGGTPQPGGESPNPKSAAGQAAQDRYDALNSGGGKLQNQLNKDKTRTMGQTLQKDAEDRLAARQIDEAAERQNYR